MDDDQGCPRCKTTKYRNPSLKLMVNVCGHTLCESCVELLFIRGSGNCQECNTPLRKSNFRVQLFEDPTVDKEVEIRKKVLKIYNKRAEDFPSLCEYNDFLEEVEDIVYNMTNNVDLENTKRRMEQYQRDNKEVIHKNKIKLTREHDEVEEALELERQENEQRRLHLQKEEQMQQLAKKKNKQALLDELENSQLPASMLLAQHKDRTAQLESQLQTQRQVKSVTFSTGIKMGQQVSLQLPKLEEALYVYQPMRVETYGPRVPEFEMLGRLGHLRVWDDRYSVSLGWRAATNALKTSHPNKWLTTKIQSGYSTILSSVLTGSLCTFGLPDCGHEDLETFSASESNIILADFQYLNHVRAATPQDLAGGYSSSLACYRALQDAFSGLFWQPS